MNSAERAQNIITALRLGQRPVLVVPMWLRQAIDLALVDLPTPRPRHVTLALEQVYRNPGVLGGMYGGRGPDVVVHVEPSQRTQLLSQGPWTLVVLPNVLEVR